MKKWILYAILLGFAVYWASNLLLWFPWSYSPTLGMTLMLTVSPFIWAYTTFIALKTYPGTNKWKGAIILSLILLLLAGIMDYVFFGIIRNALEVLYHPTTFYGYGFVLFLPFLVLLIFKKRIESQQTKVTNSRLIKAGICGLSFFGILTLIIVLGVEI